MNHLTLLLWLCDLLTELEGWFNNLIRKLNFAMQRQINFNLYTLQEDGQGFG